MNGKIGKDRERKRMKHLLRGRRGVILRMSLVIMLVLFGMMDIVGAVTTDNHQVTVQVNAINELAISPKNNITLTISTATAGSEPDPVTDETCGLLWTTNETGKKITVETDLNQQDFTLKVVATSVTGGIAASEVNFSVVGTTATDFVTSISETVGSCTLKYTASATAAQGTGSDVHTITYTIL